MQKITNFKLVFSQTGCEHYFLMGRHDDKALDYKFENNTLRLFIEDWEEALPGMIDYLKQLYKHMQSCTSDSSNG